MSSFLAKPKFSLIGPSWPFRGGIAKYTTQLASELFKRGWLKEFITPFRQYPSFLYPGETDQDPESCPKLVNAKPIFSYLEPWTWRKVISSIETTPPEKVILPFWTTAQLPFFYYLYKKLPCPAVTLLHNFQDHDTGQVFQYFSEAILSKSDFYLAHSGEITKLPFFKNREDKLAIHPLPSLAEIPMNQNKAQEILGVSSLNKTLLFFGLIRPYKGLDVFLDALERLPIKFSLNILVAGEAWQDRERIEARLSRLSKRFSVRHQLSWIPEQETSLWFSASDAVVLPYLRASGSAVAAQAQAFGKTVLASHVGGLVQQLEPGHKTFLFEPGNIESLLNILLLWIENTGPIEPQKFPKTSVPDSWESYLETLRGVSLQSSLKGSGH